MADPEGLIVAVVTSIAWVLLLSGALTVVSPAAANGLSEAAKDQLARQLLNFLGGPSAGYVAVVIEETGPSEWAPLHFVKFWAVRSDGLRRPAFVYASPDAEYMFTGSLVRVSTLVDLTEVRQGETLPRYDLRRLSAAHARTRGSPSASLRLVEFSDFQCPFCAELQPVLDRVLREHSGQVAHVFKHAPLASVHPMAERLHEAAECAARERPEAFWVFHRRFFAINTSAWDVPTMRRTTETWARELGLDPATFVACFDERATATAVKTEMSEFPVRGTPVLLVGDEVIQGAVSYERLKAIVERKLKEISR